MPAEKLFLLFINENPVDIRIFFGIYWFYKTVFKTWHINFSSIEFFSEPSEEFPQSIYFQGEMKRGGQLE